MWDAVLKVDKGGQGGDAIVVGRRWISNLGKVEMIEMLTKKIKSIVMLTKIRIIEILEEHNNRVLSMLKILKQRAITLTK